MGGNYSKKENKRWVKWWLFKEKTVRWLGFFLLSVGYFPLFFFFWGGFVLEPVHWPRALPCTCAVLCSKYRTNLWGWKPSQHLSLPTFLWENELRRSNIKFRFSPKTFTHELECLGSLLLRLDFLPLVTIFLLFRGQYYKKKFTQILKLQLMTAIDFYLRTILPPKDLFDNRKY